MKMSEDQMFLAEKLFKEAFKGPRDLRSNEYKSGVMAALVYRFTGVQIAENSPYMVGTAENYAFAAGCDEGNQRWREWSENQVYLDAM